MTSYDDTKVQLTINRMTQECYENVPNKSSTELYLISQNPTSIAKIDLDAQSRTDAEISSIQSDLNVLQSDLNDLSTEVSTLSEWTTTQIDDLIGDVQEVSSQTAQNAQDIADISANLTHSTVRRWEYVEYNGLTFTAEEANSTVAMQKVGSAPDVSLEYSTGNGWHDFIVGETTVTLPAIGDQMVLRAKTTNSGMGSGATTYNKFVMTGKIAASNSIMYLLKNDGDLDTISSNYCFCRLFYQCAAMTSTPELPATTLSQGCYQSLFEGCQSLTSTPELPATTLVESCYSTMFAGCTSLTSAPELPATTMATRCYQNMFQNCTSLTTAPELPSTALADRCYVYMFYGCTSLTQAPELPATTLATYCYYAMFQNCSSLNSIKIGYTGNFSGTGVPTDAFSNWVSGVSASGTFYYDGEDTTTGNSAIPTGWDVQPLVPQYQGLTFVATQANSTVSMVVNGSDVPTISLEYSTDNGSTWSDFIVGTTTVTLANVGDKMCVRAKTTNQKFARDWWNQNAFRLTGKFNLKGSVYSLLDKDWETNLTTVGEFALCHIFDGSVGEMDISELSPLDKPMSAQCYNGLFANSGIVGDAPKGLLPSTTLAQDCYGGMFSHTSIEHGPDLPATVGVEGCYDQMFYDCDTIEEPPMLNLTTLTTRCFNEMFRNSPNVNVIKLAYTGTFGSAPDHAFYNWVDGVSADGTFYYNGSDTSNFGSSAIPSGWTVQTF